MKSNNCLWCKEGPVTPQKPSILPIEILPPKVPGEDPLAHFNQEPIASSQGTSGAICQSCLGERFDTYYVALSCCLLLTSLSFFKTQSAALSIKLLLSGWPFDQFHACMYLEHLLISDFLSAICWRDYKLKSERQTTGFNVSRFTF